MFRINVWQRRTAIAVIGSYVAEMMPEPFNYLFYARSATDWQRRRTVQGTLMRCLSDNTTTADVLIGKRSIVNIMPSIIIKSHNDTIDYMLSDFFFVSFTSFLFIFVCHQRTREKNSSSWRHTIIYRSSAYVKHACRHVEKPQTPIQNCLLRNAKYFENRFLNIGFSKKKKTNFRFE